MTYECCVVAYRAKMYNAVITRERERERAKQIRLINMACELNRPSLAIQRTLPFALNTYYNVINLWTFLFWSAIFYVNNPVYGSEVSNK